MLPNFYLVGAPKAGTTSLFAYLGQHPQVYTSAVKEPCYFADEVTELRKAGIVWDRNDYLKLFAGAREGQAIGEGSVIYLGSPTAAANIAAATPDARILMMLRDPPERAFSQYLQYRTSGNVRVSFGEQIRRGVKSSGGKIGKDYPFLEFGLYYEQVSRYLRLFPRARVHVAFYDDFRREPARSVRDILEFLGVDPNFEIDFSQRHNQPRVPRFGTAGYILKRLGIWQRGRRMIPRALVPLLRPLALAPREALTMEPKDREYLVAHYRENIRSLEGLVNRDLGSWLR